MATQGFKVSFSTITDPVILVWYLHTAPAAEVNRVVLPFPNLSGEVVEAHDLLPTTYLFKFYRSADGSTLDELIEGWSVDVAKGTRSLLQRYFYVVGRGELYDPAPNQPVLSDERLVGADALYVFNRGTGYRSPDDFTLLDEGGFTLLHEELFSNEDEWMVEVVTNEDQITSMPGSFDSGAVHLVSEDGSFDASYRGVENIADFPAASTGVTTFPALALIANGRCLFSTYATEGRYWRLQLATGDTVRHLGEDVNSITLRQNERLELVFNSGACYVVDYRGGAELAGEVVKADKKLINTEYADGSEADIADYQDLIDRLPVEKMVSYDDWNLYVDVTVGEVTKRYYKNRGKFAVDALAGTFRFPDLRGQSFRALKNVDGADDSSMLSQGAGGMWAQQIISHKHPVTIPSKDFQSQNAHGQNLTGPGDGELDTQNFVTAAVGGSEQRVDSIGQYALIRI